MTTTAALFSALVFAVALMLVAAIRAAFASSLRATALGAAAVAAWLGITAMLAASGVLADFRGTPPLFVRFMGGCALLSILLVLSPFGRRLAVGVPLAALVGMQVFRLPVELLLHRLHADGLVPVQMTYLGRNFDVVTALLAVPVALLVASRGERDVLARRVALAFNLVGVGLLANIVVVALLSAPGSLRVFMNEPANTFVTTVPYVWLPTLLVLTALLGHLLLFRRLWGKAPEPSDGVTAHAPSELHARRDVA
ncbi:MAG: hypothetical protein IPL19_15275 [Sandaracinaceae bacterium]|jgi:hypothetical protein|nr:hypothetical protein [Sandaracinaceae bacterium]MBK7775779.1 hypothetical protein [Sandaracinaceae bacterium]MBK8409333.1 hypothetical protein [Sandaracinaceae bacterium]MBP7680717.1 hypothetical protein [Deltaproteobacteria bacterium]